MNGSTGDTLRDEAERRLRRSKGRELGDLNPSTITGIGNDLTTTSSPEVKTEYPFLVLVCSECCEYYEQAEGWEYCPKCGDELAEVEKA